MAKYNKRKLREDSEFSDDVEGVGLPKGPEGDYSDFVDSDVDSEESGDVEGVGLDVGMQESDDEFMDLFKEEFGCDEEELSEEDEEEHLDEEELEVHPKEKELEVVHEDDEEFVNSDDEVLIDSEDEELEENDELEDLIGESDEEEELPVDLDEDDDVFVLDDEELSEEELEAGKDPVELKPIEVLEDEDEEQKEIQEHVRAMFKGSKVKLDEGFKNKVETIFEAAIRNKSKKMKLQLEEKANKKIKSLKESMYKKYGKRVSQYLNVVVEDWKKENKIAIENSFRSKITESFIKDLRQLFLRHDIDVPAAKQNLVHKMGKKLEESKSELSKQVSTNLAQSKRIKMLEKRIILAKECENLSSMQADKLKKLAESVVYTDAKKFSNKLKMFKESYLNRPIARKSEIEKVESKPFSDSGRNSVMNKYVNAARKVGK